MTFSPGCDDLPNTTSRRYSTVRYCDRDAGIGKARLFEPVAFAEVPGAKIVHPTKRSRKHWQRRAHKRIRKMLLSLRRRFDNSKNVQDQIDDWFATVAKVCPPLHFVRAAH